MTHLVGKKIIALKNTKVDNITHNHKTFILQGTIIEVIGLTHIRGWVHIKIPNCPIYQAIDVNRIGEDFQIIPEHRDNYGKTIN